MSSIEWTDETWNPVIGCSSAPTGDRDTGSPGCALCYAGTMAKRQVGMVKGQQAKWDEAHPDGARGPNDVEGQPVPPRPCDSPYLDVINIDEPGKKKRTGAAVWSGQTRFLPERLADPLSWRKSRMVFAPSMSDFFHKTVDFDHVAAILGVMAATPQHTYQVLTKRPARLLEFLRWLTATAPTVLGGGAIEGRAVVASLSPHATPSQPRLLAAQTELAIAVEAGALWPLPNVWFGVSVEDQKRAGERLPLLAEVRAQGWHTFVSAEPLIGPINGGQWSAAEWVIIGGESGPQARRCAGEWMRRIRDEAHGVGCAVFVKQLGRRFDDRTGTGIVGAGYSPDSGIEESMRVLGGMPRTHIKSIKGNDPAEWPADLRVREWPEGMRR